MVAPSKKRIGYVLEEHSFFVGKSYLINKNNTTTMSVKIESGKWTTVWRMKKASTAFATASLADLNAGYVIPSTSGSGATDKPVLGVYTRPAITSATVGTYLYSNTAKIPIQVPIGPATIRCTTTSGLAQTDEGKQMDMSDSTNVAYAGTTYGCVTLVKYISTTEGIYTISKSIYANVA